MQDLKISKGQWQSVEFAGTLYIQSGPMYTDANILDYARVGKEIADNNAELMIDAGITAQRCGLYPSELLAQRDSLVSEIERLKAEKWLTEEGKAWATLNEIINQIKGENTNG